MCTRCASFALLYSAGFRRESEPARCCAVGGFLGGEPDFFRVGVRFIFLTHKPFTSFPQFRTSVMLRIYRLLTMWKTRVCLWTANRLKWTALWGAVPPEKNDARSIVPDLPRVPRGCASTLSLAWKTPRSRRKKTRASRTGFAPWRVRNPAL